MFSPYGGHDVRLEHKAGRDPAASLRWSCAELQLAVGHTKRTSGSALQALCLVVQDVAPCEVRVVFVLQTEGNVDEVGAHVEKVPALLLPASLWASLVVHVGITCRMGCPSSAPARR